MFVLVKIYIAKKHFVSLFAFRQKLFLDIYFSLLSFAFFCLWFLICFCFLFGYILFIAMVFSNRGSFHGYDFSNRYIKFLYLDLEIGGLSSPCLLSGLQRNILYVDKNPPFKIPKSAIAIIEKIEHVG